MPKNSSFRMGRYARAAIVVPVVLSSLVAIDVVAASPASAACSPEKDYSITKKTSYHLPAPGTHFKDGPGGTITASVTKATTVSASATVSAGASVKGIVAEAKIEVSGTVTRSKTITIGHTYTHNISKKKYGHLQYGSWGYQLSWKYERQNGNCTFTTLASGTNAKVPTSVIGWKYWQTSS
jgi:hypothetical protein